MGEWDENEFQGRSKDHIERNYKSFGMLFRLIVIVGFGIIIYAIIKDVI
jgi:hypothetical protein